MWGIVPANDENLRCILLCLLYKIFDIGGDYIKYYVYEWFNIDNGEVFYVGKGSGKRYQKNKKRNDVFEAYVASNNCDVRIVKNNMSEKCAHDLENKLIERYKGMNQCCANLQLGGMGFQYMCGDKNPMYGRPWYDENTPQEKIDEWKSKVGNPGESNPMFGISPRERMDDETYRRWIEGHKKIVGKKNPNYGNKKLSKFYRENPDVAIEKQSRAGAKNGRCVPVEMFDLNWNFVARFDYLIECAEYLNSNGFTKTKPSYAATTIFDAAKMGKQAYSHYYKIADK